MKKSRFILTLGIVLALATAFVKCGEKPFRAKQIMAQNAGGASDEEQVTKLTDVLNSSDEEKKELLKQEFVKETFKEVVQKVVPVMQALQKPVTKTLAAMDELGVLPEDEKERVVRGADGKIYINSAKSVNGLRYFRAGFEQEASSSAIAESFFFFELEPFDGAFDFAVETLKETYPNIGEPCFDTKQNQIFFRDGDYLIEVFEETADSLDLKSIFPPRTNADIGAVSIVVNSNPHVEVCGFSHVHNDGYDDHDHDHEENYDEPN